MQTIKNKKDSMLESIKNREGFTLIELIVVMAIIAILVLLAAPRFLGYTKDANVAAVQQDVKVLSDAAFLYNVDEEAWPAGAAVTGAGATLAQTAQEEYEAVNPPAEGEDPVTVEVLALDESKLSNYIKNTKNDIDEYGLITNGVNEGSVVHLEGVEDKDGNEVFGIGDFDERD